LDIQYKSTCSNPPRAKNAEARTYVPTIEIAVCWIPSQLGFGILLRLPEESKRRARDSRAPHAEGGADGCDGRALSA